MKNKQGNFSAPQVSKDKRGRDLIPLEDLAIPEETAEDVARSFQKWRKGDNHSEESTEIGWPDYAMPVGIYKNKPDYQ